MVWTQYLTEMHKLDIWELGKAAFVGFWSTTETPRWSIGELSKLCAHFVCLFVDSTCGMWFYLEMVLHDLNHNNLSLPMMYGMTIHSTWGTRDDGPKGSSGLCRHCCLMVVKYVQKPFAFVSFVYIDLCSDLHGIIKKANHIQHRSQCANEDRELSFWISRTRIIHTDMQTELICRQIKQQ